MEPLVSIIIPTYNRASVIGRSIQSVFSQTYQNLECIVVDDGSTDDTRAAIEQFQDPRLKFFSHEVNRGVSAARNTGIKKSQGKFVALLDSDDEFLPEKIARSIEFFKKRQDPKLGAVCSNFYKQQGLNRTASVAQKQPFLYFPVFKMEVFSSVGLFNEQVEVYEDLEFSARFYCQFKRCFISDPLSIYHFTQDSLSSAFSDILRLIEIKQMILEKQGKDLYEAKDCLAIKLGALINYYIAKDYLNLCNRAKARKYFLESFLRYPIKIEYFWKFLMCF